MFETDATSLPRLIACNGSRLMGGIIPPIVQTNIVRDEGNAAHYLAYKLFQHNENIDKYLDQKSPFEVIFDKYMIQHVQDYYSHCIARNAPLFPEYSYELNGSTWRIGGRSDLICFDGTTLFIDEFKYGWQIVEPKENWTLLSHAFGYCLDNNVQPVKIVFTVHQPRPRHPLGPVRTWSIGYQEMCAYWQKCFVALDNLTDYLTTGPHCLKCKFQANCPASTLAVANALEMTSEAQNDNIDDVSLSQQLLIIERALQILNQKYDAYRSLAEYRLRKGHNVPDFALQTAKANTQWKKGCNDPDLMRALFGENIIEEKLRSPTQAIKNKIPEGFIDMFSHRPDTSPKLTKISADDRAKKYFQN